MRIVCNEIKGQEWFNRTCPYCKRSVTLCRGDNEAVFFDNKVYHTDCYMKSKSVQRKCKCCKKIMHFASEADVKNSGVYFYMGSYYHKGCFDSLCEDGIHRNSVKWRNASKNKQSYRDDAKTNLSNLLKQRELNDEQMKHGKNDLDDYVARVFAEHDVDELLKANYDIPTSGNFFHRYLQPLYQGTSSKYEDVKIPAVHLLEMWNTMMPVFIKKHQKRLEQGKSFTNIQRAAYDLTILVSKYDSFLSWKNQQKVLEIDQEEMKKSIDNNINYHAIKSQHSGHTNEIDEVLKDIFNN